MTTSTSLNDVVDIERRPGIAEDIAAAVRSVLYPRVSIDVGAVAEMVAELVDNFAQHSMGPPAAFAMQWYPRGNRLDLAIGDCGIGIRSSLAKNPLYSGLLQRPDYEAAAKAFEFRVTGNPALGGGMGLSEVRETVRALKGGLSLATGDGYVVVGAEGMRTGRMAFDLPGVQIWVWVPVGR